MGTFGEYVARRPPRVVVVSPNAFADGWKGKPSADVAIGLRLLSEADVQTARAEAAKLAIEHHPEGGAEQDDAFNDALMRWAVARAATDPNDVHKPYFETAEDTVREALTSRGVQRLYEELELLTIETSPLHAEASEEELRTLGRWLCTGVVSPRWRRILRQCFEEAGLALNLDIARTTSTTTASQSAPRSNATRG